MNTLQRNFPHSDDPHGPPLHGPSPHDTRRQREFSGRWIVLGLFAFGLLSTSVIWLYWQWHMEPFMPLQMALAAEFEDSSPRVEGGREKLHQDTPSILRISMRVPFDPTRPDAPVDALLMRVARIAADHLALQDYETFELHLYHPQAEQQLIQHSLSRPMPEVLQRLRSSRGA